VRCDVEREKKKVKKEKILIATLVDFFVVLHFDILRKLK